MCIDIPVCISRSPPLSIYIYISVAVSLSIVIPLPILCHSDRKANMHTIFPHNLTPCCPFGQRTVQGCVASHSVCTTCKYKKYG